MPARFGSETQTRMAEFDRDRVAGDALAEPGHIIEIARAADKIGRKLKQQHPELAGLAQRPKRAREHLETEIQHGTGRVLQARHGPLLRAEHLLDRDRKPCGVRRMLRQQRERLEVEDEIIGRALGPQPRIFLGGQRVVTGVNFHGLEVPGVKSKPVLSGLRRRRIKGVRLDQARIGPRGRTDQKLRSLAS